MQNKILVKPTYVVDEGKRGGRATHFLMVGFRVADKFFQHTNR